MKERVKVFQNGNGQNQGCTIYVVCSQSAGFLELKIIPFLCFKYFNPSQRKHSGSVVECLTQDGGAAGSSLKGVAVLCP